MRSYTRREASKEVEVEDTDRVERAVEHHRGEEGALLLVEEAEEEGEEEEGADDGDIAEALSRCVVEEREARRGDEDRLARAEVLADVGLEKAAEESLFDQGGEDDDGDDGEGEVERAVEG